MIVIGEMNEAEIPIVSNLLISCYRWLGETESFPREFIEYLIAERGSTETVLRESEDQVYLVAKIGDGIAGMAAIKDNKITKLYVLPEQHHKGIGRSLFEAAEKLIIENGFDVLSLVALGESPIPFYRAMGMCIAGQKKSTIPSYEGGEVTLMEKAFIR